MRVRHLLACVQAVAAPSNLPATGEAQQGQASICSLTRELHIDGKREDFALLQGGRLGPRNLLALTFMTDAQVVLYNDMGKRVATVGRRGSGPGEFRMPVVRGWLADTLWIHDMQLARLTFATSTGSVIRDISLQSLPRMRSEPPDSLVDFLFFSPSGRRLDGAMTGTATMVRRSPGGRATREGVIVAVSADGLTKRLATTEADARWEPALAVPNLYAFASDGSEVVHLRVTDLREAGEQLLVTRVQAPTGDTIFSARLPYRGVPLSKRMLDSILARGVGVDRLHVVPSNRIPSVLAPVANVYAEPNGATWLSLRQSEVRLGVLALNRKGAPFAQFELPPRSRLLAATAENVWLVQEDVDGIQSVDRYKLTCRATR